MPDYGYMNPYGSYAQYGGQQPFGNLNQYYQNQLNELYQRQQAAQQPQAQQPLNNSGFTVRPATNIDEVRATPIQLMTTNIFVNMAQGEIYVARIDDNGLKDIRTFRLSKDAPESGVTVADAKSVDLSEIHMRFDRLESMMGVTHDESVANGNAGVQKRGKSAGGVNAADEADGK